MLSMLFYPSKLSFLSLVPAIEKKSAFPRFWPIVRWGEAGAVTGFSQSYHRDFYLLKTERDTHGGGTEIFQKLFYATPQCSIS